MPRTSGQLYVRRPHHHVHIHSLVRLVLKEDGQLELVAKVEEAGRRGTHHQRQPRRDRRFPLAKVLFLGHGDHHHPVAGQVIGQLDPHRSGAVRIGGRGRLKGGQRVEIGAHADGLALFARTGGRFLFHQFRGRNRLFDLFDRRRCTHPQTASELRASHGLFFQQLVGIDQQDVTTQVIVAHPR